MKDFMARRILVDFEWTSTSISWGSLERVDGQYRLALTYLSWTPGMAAGAFLIAGAGSGRLFFANRS